MALCNGTNIHRRVAKSAKKVSIFFSAERAEKKKNSIFSSMELMDINKISSKIIGSAIEVHKSLGPGLLESVYEECLCHELGLRDLSYKRQKPLPVIYKGKTLNCGNKLDVVVENRIIVELKSCQKIEPIHKAQLLTYLKLSILSFGIAFEF